jgi:hypothetical protein
MRGDITKEMWNDIEDAIEAAISGMVLKYPGHNHYTVERLFLAVLLRDINAGKRRLIEFAGGSNGPPQTAASNRRRS